MSLRSDRYAMSRMPITQGLVSSWIISSYQGSIVIAGHLMVGYRTLINDGSCPLLLDFYIYLESDIYTMAQEYLPYDISK
ncbi:hypothetical protein BDV30DRAFT_207791 [Aspergillus minisclerotigenes]|uniref:Uncharacterized protein n=1 Tax=Aspergillus minisclerotigenes TaxID=656917 RepID=A0A5N6JC25_9EURO|nr:hypothetical protein BDV30DRAFT_207791 [Aspergillus minisclerotigenes]